MTPLRSLILWALLVGTCWGQPPLEVQQAICRVTSDGSAGTGTLVGKDGHSGLVVSCYHVFRDGASNIVATFPTGEAFQGRIVAKDEVNDLAAIVISPPSVEPVALSLARPAKGDALHSAGFGSTITNSLQINSGVVTKYVDLPNDGSFTGIKISGTARPGDSGGPIFNERNELSAVLWGGNQDGVYGSTTSVLDVMLMQCPQGVVCRPRYANQSEWRPAPKKPVPPRPQPPAKPVPSTSPPPAGAAGCKCDTSSVCKCDKKPVRECVCDKNELDALRKEIESLKVLIASGKLKGDKGDKGEPGASAAGEKIILAIEQPDGKIVQATGIIGKKPNGKYDRFVLPLKPQPKKK